MTEQEADSVRAARLIAALYYADTGVELDPYRLCTFINSRWDRVAPLAHRVHGGEKADVTKSIGMASNTNEGQGSVL